MGRSAHGNSGLAQSDGPQWKYKVGDKFEVVLNQTSKSETKVDARETTIDNATTIEMDWEVTKVDANGDATVEQSLSRVKLSVNGFTRKKQGDPATPLKDIGFDTSNPADISSDSKTLLEQIQPLIGLQFSVVMSSDGEIIDVIVSPDVAKQLEKMPDTQRLRQLFEKDGLKDIMGASAMTLPEDLSAGKSWTEEAQTTTAFGKFDRTRTYTYVGDKESDGAEMAEFTLDVAMKPVDSDASTENSLKSKLLEFEGSGVLLMDLDGGFLRSSKVRNRAHSEKPYREKNIDTVINNQIDTTVTKK